MQQRVFVSLIAILGAIALGIGIGGYSFWLLGSKADEQAMIGDLPDYAKMFAEHGATNQDDPLAARESPPDPTIEPVGQAAKEGKITMNGQQLTQEQMELLVSFNAGQPLIPGHYWYDSKSGLYGTIGYPTAGQMAANLAFAPITADASGGDTGFFANGRELTQVEVQYMRNVSGELDSGNYWIEANGNYGLEGSTDVLGNIFPSGSPQGGDNSWSSGQYSGGNYDNGNSRGYVSVPGVGPVGYGFD